jgi:hypothetical protein
MRNQLIRDIWTPPSQWKTPGTWFWWFWLFFIHDGDTAKTGRCRQLMILWSIKKDKRISCNSLDIQIPVQIEKKGEKRWTLNGAAAAWYFDGKTMHHDFVLEKSAMELDGDELSLTAPGNTPSSFYLDGDEFVTKIKTIDENARAHEGDTHGHGKDALAGEPRFHEFEFRARQTDFHPANGPVQSRTSLPFGMGVEGTMIERFELKGFETRNGKKSEIRGAAYLQKILVAVPPPQWYWGMYHFSDDSILTFMVSYAGRAILADNAWKGARLRRPTIPIKQDIMLYHAPTGRVFKATDVSITPRSEGGPLWSHEVKGKGKDFDIDALAKAYSHSSWRFVKNVGALPAKSTFIYNEYPAVLERLELRTKKGEKITLRNGWGNMENSWGFIL